jgi:bifunctional DNase/RNase
MRKGLRMVEMEVVAVQPEPNSNHPLVWLKDKTQRFYLPIAIGNFEATAIYMALYDDPPPRPIAYDLLESILDGFDIQVEQILIHALKDETFYAEVILLKGETRLRLDSRPSDAIALALRLKSPIFVADEVLAEAALPVKTGVQEEQLEHFESKDELPELKDTGFGRVEQQVIALRARLQDVVVREEYEEAAKLRDEIDRLEYTLQNR